MAMLSLAAILWLCCTAPQGSFEDMYDDDDEEHGGGRFKAFSGAARTLAGAHMPAGSMVLHVQVTLLRAAVCWAGLY